MPSSALVIRMLAAVAGGAILFVSFPPRPLWWLAPLGFVLFGLVLKGRRMRAGFGYGLLFGLGFMVPLLQWSSVYVGLVAWLPLALLEALFIALAGAGMAAVTRLPGWPVWAAGLWIAGEAVRSRVPFGGFPWGKVAFGQPEGLFLPLASVGGTALLGFSVVLCGFGLAALILRLRSDSEPTPKVLALPIAAFVLPVVAGLALGPLVTNIPDSGTATAALVQGNVPRAGLDFNSQRRAVLDNHAKRTEQLAQDVADGKKSKPDFVIWPENSSDIDPLRNPDAYAVISTAVNKIGVPTMVGALLAPEVGNLRNTALLWQPNQGPVDEYTKRKIQPFGEWMPMRSFVRLFSPEVDRVRRDQEPGDVPKAFAMGNVKVGVATCFEVAFDDAVNDTVRAGAQIIAVPSNNATFGYTEMTYQQLAMSQVRAVEHGRAVLVAATSGVSAVVMPDGTVTQRTGMFVPDALVAELPLRSTTTLATRLGPWPERMFAAAGLVALVIALVAARRHRRAKDVSTPEPPVAAA